MRHRGLVGSTRARSAVRTLSQHEELPCYAIIFWGSIERAAMIAFMASSTTASLRATPKNAPTKSALGCRQRHPKPKRKYAASRQPEPRQYSVAQFLGRKLVLAASLARCFRP
jgi:hypothetical protein